MSRHKKLSADRLAGLNILLLDDSSDARRVGRIALQSAGFTQVIEAAGGQEALNILSAVDCKVDVVLCDLMMPEIDGIQFLRFASGLARKPAIVFVSGGESELLQGAQDIARARNFNVLGVIQKPVRSDAIKRTLSKYHDAVETAGRPPAPRMDLDLENGLQEQQFVLHYQPKVSVMGRDLVGVEALVRWQHPKHGLIPPGLFIADAEKSGQIAPLTEQIVAMALRQWADWATDGFRPKISINLSPYMLGDLEIPDRIANLAALHGVAPQQIVLEITESGVFQELANTLEILTRLRMKGFSLSIDDFGTGYSSMEQLRRVPFTELKIDRAFVNGAADNDKARAILEGNVKLGRSLGMVIVAEGAETEEDWAALEKAGVDLVQGYFIAKPMSAPDFHGWRNQRAA